jgi:ABC-type nitrate/sulfonate/bicarbonate transport system ATPase subunit
VALLLENVAFAYDGGRPVFNGLTVRFDAWGVTAILGPSGCGKSTLLRLIAGLLPSTHAQRFSGTVSLGELPPINVLRKGGDVAFVSQESSLLPFLSTADNILFPLQILKRGPATDFHELLRAVGLEDSQTMYPSELSTGMRLRTTLARAFITAPTLLLLDEPFASLDLAWKRALYREFLRLRLMSPSTCVIVTHDVIEAMLLADAVIIIDARGNVVQSVAMPANRPTEFSSPELHTYLNATATLAADLQAFVLAAAEYGGA